MSGTKYLVNELLFQILNYAEWKNTNTARECWTTGKNFIAKFQHSHRDTPAAARINFSASSSADEHPPPRTGKKTSAPVLPWYSALHALLPTQKPLRWTSLDPGLNRQSQKHMSRSSQGSPQNHKLKRPNHEPNGTGVSTWDKLFAYELLETHTNTETLLSKSKVERPISPLPSHECGLTYHTPPQLDPGKYTPRPSSVAQIVGWVPGERGCPLGFRGFWWSPGETRLQRALSKTERGKKIQICPRWRMA